MTAQAKTIEQLQRECRAWNAAHPVGSSVLYHSVIGRPATVRTTVAQPAYLFGDVIVVEVEGVRGCVLLGDIEVER